MLSGERAETIRSGPLETAPVRKPMIVVGLGLAEERYGRLHRHSARANPVPCP
jgi:hypothetical protein